MSHCTWRIGCAAWESFIGATLAACRRTLCVALSHVGEERHVHVCMVYTHRATAERKERVLLRAEECMTWTCLKHGLSVMYWQLCQMQACCMLDVQIHSVRSH